MVAVTGEERMTREEFVAEVAWLLSFGTHPSVIAINLGQSAPTIARRLQRAGRSDLAAPFELEAKRK